QVVTFVKTTFGAKPTSPPAASQSLLMAGHLAPDLDVTLTFSPPSGAAEEFVASFTDANKNPASNIDRATLELLPLDQGGRDQQVAMQTNSSGTFRAAASLGSASTFWLIRVTAHLTSGAVTVEFPYQSGGTVQAVDPRAKQLLQQSDARMNLLKSRSAVQDLNDGKNGSVTTHYEYQAPDRLRYQVVGGIESIAVGATQFDLEDGAWSSRSRPDPYVFPNFDDITPATGIRLGRALDLGGVQTQVVETTTVSGGTAISYAFWIGVDDHLIRQFAMLGPAHYMMQYYSGFDAPVDIQTPTPGTVFERRQAGSLDIAFTLAPHAAGESDFDVALTDAAGKPVTDAQRVMLVTGMTDMSHGANSLLAEPVGGGHYHARGPWLYMAGQWQIGLVVQLAGDETQTAVFEANVPASPGPVVSERVDDSPSAIDQVNVLVYPGSIVPASVDVAAGKIVRVTAMLMAADQNPCGGEMTLPELGLASTFGDAGIGEIQFTSPRAAQLRFSCDASGLAVAIRAPLQPDS
ncbi:MAG: FixH family protein, partial [Chloroflexi bacterium]|nr:FixH family protein [Chloroflexota bacterium]